MNAGRLGRVQMPSYAKNIEARRTTSVVCREDDQRCRLLAQIEEIFIVEHCLIQVDSSQPRETTSIMRQDLAFLVARPCHQEA